MGSNIVSKTRKEVQWRKLQLIVIPLLIDGSIIVDVYLEGENIPKYFPDFLYSDELGKLLRKSISNTLSIIMNEKTNEQEEKKYVNDFMQYILDHEFPKKFNYQGQDLGGDEYKEGSMIQLVVPQKESKAGRPYVLNSNEDLIQLEQSVKGMVVKRWREIRSTRIVGPDEDNLIVSEAISPEKFLFFKNEECKEIVLNTIECTVLKVLVMEENVLEDILMIHSHRLDPIQSFSVKPIKENDIK